MLVDDGITPNIHVTKKYFAYFTRSHRPNCCRKLASKPEKNDSIRDVSCLNRCTEFHTSQGGMGLRKMTNSSIV